VAIVERGEVVYKRHFGLASLEQNVPISSRTRFDLGSVSKQFTAMAVLMLEREGMLSLDDTIQTYLRELPRYKDPVRLRNLLYQTSGLWDYWQVLPYTGYRKQDYLALDDVVRLLQGQKTLKFEPGSRWSYCNTNYVFLAEIVARVTGESFTDWTKHKIFVPLKMWDSFVQSDCFALIPGRAEAYRNKDQGFFRDHQLNVDFAGQSHIFSTIEDMIRWVDNFRTRSLGGKMLMTRMARKGELNDGSEIVYAAGLGVEKYRGAVTIGHSGSTGGFKSIVLYLPDFQLGIVILANVRSLNPEKKAHRMLDIYLRGNLEPLPMRPVRKPEPFIQLDSTITRNYTGGYLMADGEARLALFPAGDHLMGAISGLGMDSFFPLSETEFSTRNRKVRLTVQTDEMGLGSSVQIDLKGKHLQATRIRTDTTIATMMTECAGTYYSDALGVFYELTPREEGLLLSHPRMGERILQYVDRDLVVGRPGWLKFYRDLEGQVQGFFLEDEVFGKGDLCFAKWIR
jgi:CubicO group peptidase (beta-lactamase class C family)